MRPPRAPRGATEMDRIDELLADLASATCGADRRAVLIAADQADVATALVVCERPACRDTRPVRLQSMVRHVIAAEMSRGWPPPTDPPLHRPEHLRRASGIEYATYEPE